MFSIKVLDLKQQGYPDWFRGLRLILTLVGDSVHTYLQKEMSMSTLANQTFLQGAVVSLLCSLGLSMGIGITPLQSTLLT